MECKVNRLFSVLARGGRSPYGREVCGRVEADDRFEAVLAAACPAGEPAYQAFCADQAVQAAAGSYLAGRLRELDPVNTYAFPLRHAWAAEVDCASASARVSLNAGPRSWVAGELRARANQALGLVYASWRGPERAEPCALAEGSAAFNVAGLGRVELAGWDYAPLTVSITAPFERELTELEAALRSKPMPWHTPELREAFDSKFELRDRVAAAVLNILMEHKGA
jgi:hypothetical protein